MLTILGPTATGKTALAARLAFELNGEVISADSRQVYRGMNIGTGKDYDDYRVNGVQVPFHLIDIVDPGYEYNIFEYQKDFLNAYLDILARKKLPILCGGSGMYLEAVLKGYRLASSGKDDEYLASLQDKPEEQLIEILKSYKTLHNITDFEDRARLLKAIMVAHASDKSQSAGKDVPAPGDQEFPRIESAIYGINYPRGLVKARIVKRLEHRLAHGMIAEVEQLLAGGIAPERLMKYGLEYKFITLFLLGKISRSDLFFELNIAIRQFAKRQMTWFRRMERQGIKIHWIDGRLSLDEKVAEIKNFKILVSLSIAKNRKS
ncbi:MAG: tRNA (adenosine(37)-N6)-dimethylallyltransferase MiaA [Bacteroidetes bacterium]|nr:tRNA (adenosine(37)-N6)-dimethylallyltransferase MiaA [Bacteroidota bacterium]